MRGQDPERERELLPLTPLLLCLFRQQRRHLSEYLAEITIQEFPFIDYKPSQIAASAVCLTLHTVSSCFPRNLSVRKLRWA